MMADYIQSELVTDFCLPIDPGVWNQAHNYKLEYLDLLPR